MVSRCGGQQLSSVSTGGIFVAKRSRGEGCDAGYHYQIELRGVAERRSATERTSAAKRSGPRGEGNGQRSGTQRRCTGVVLLSAKNHSLGPFLGRRLQ